MKKEHEAILQRIIENILISIERIHERLKKLEEPKQFKRCSCEIKY